MLSFSTLLGMEIPLFLYIFAGDLQHPVFQNLIYEKECLLKFEQNVTFCRDYSNYYKDKDIQTAANHFYFISSLTLMIPSLITTLLLGAVSDYWSVKIPLLIPYIGSIIASINYVIQSIFIHSNIYYLLISDALFGLCGGYIAIISTTLTYGVKNSLIRHRSYRIAGIEGAIGLGGTIGYALSGTIREASGYVTIFLIVIGLEVLALVYLLLVAKETEFDRPPVDENTSLINGASKQIIGVLHDFYKVLTKKRTFHLILILNLLAFGIELLIFSGLGDIQFSYLRYKLGWGDKKYGWFSGLSYGITTATVIFLYPLFRMFIKSDGLLAAWGLMFKFASLIMLAFIQNDVMAFAIAVVVMFNRFVSTGFRAFISNLIEMNEQGKIFSIIAMMEGISSLVATSIYNNIYPKTLSFFPGLLYVISAALLLIPLIIVGSSDLYVRSKTDNNTSSVDVSDDILDSHNDVIEDSNSM